jgi:hypothetical protein
MMHQRRQGLALYLASCGGLALLCCGCAEPPNRPPPATQVKGAVNIDGKPVPTGEIHFGIPGLPPSILSIKDGQYAGEAPIGPNKVEVYIYVDGPPSEKDPKTPTKINTTPERYVGPKTILEAKVEPGAANDFKFDISAR